MDLEFSMNVGVACPVNQPHVRVSCKGYPYGLYARIQTRNHRKHEDSQVHRKRANHDIASALSAFAVSSDSRRSPLQA